MGQDKRMDMGPMGDYNGMMGKGHGPRHQLHKEPPMDRGPYYDKVGPRESQCAVGCSAMKPLQKDVCNRLAWGNIHQVGSSALSPMLQAETTRF